MFFHPTLRPCFCTLCVRFFNPFTTLGRDKSRRAGNKVPQKFRGLKQCANGDVERQKFAGVRKGERSPDPGGECALRRWRMSKVSRMRDKKNTAFTPHLVSSRRGAGWLPILGHNFILRGRGKSPQGRFHHWPAFLFQREDLFVRSYSE